MAIDPVDIARDETRRAENKRSADRKDQKEKLAGQDFASKFQTKLKTKETQSETAKGAEAERGKQEEDVLHRVMAAFRGKEEGKGDERKESARKEDVKKEESKKEKFGEETSSTESRYKSVADDGHARVASKHGSNQGEGDGGGGGQGGNSHSGSGDQSGGGDKGSGSFSGQGGDSGKNADGGFKKGITGRAVFQAREVPQGKTQDDKGGSNRSFTPKNLDELVSAVHVGLNANLETEMEITLSDEFFSGLKLKATKTGGGVIITFHCPNKSVRDLFLINRPQVYARLKEKKLPVSRIDVVM